MDGRKYKKGILFINTKSKEQNSFASSVLKIAKENKEIKFAILSELDSIKSIQDVFLVPMKEGLSLPQMLALSPFQRTLLLSERAFLTKDISNTFEILNKFDIAVTQDLFDATTKDDEEIPFDFPRFNTDIILYIQNQNFKNFSSLWHHYLQGGLKLGDSFRKAIWDQDIDLYVLPPEFNVKNDNLLNLWKNKEVYPQILNFIGSEPWKKYIMDQKKIKWRMKNSVRKLKDILWEFTH